MKLELIKILETRYSELSANQKFIDYINLLIDFYEEIKIEATQKVISVLKYYNYSNRSNFVNPKEYQHLKNIYPHIMLNKEPGEYGIQVLLDYDGGIVKGNDDFENLISDPKIYYDESLESHPDIYDIHTNIIILWLVTIWQKIDGNQYGIIVKFDEHGESYFFNDQKWNDYSTCQFDHEIKNNVLPNIKYTITEIYNAVLKK